MRQTTEFRTDRRTECGAGAGKAVDTLFVITFVKVEELPHTTTTYFPLHLLAIIKVSRPLLS